jgi:hypothetical protein
VKTERTIRLRMKVSEASAEGWAFNVGAVVDVREALAKQFLAAGKAELATQAELTPMPVECALGHSEWAPGCRFCYATFGL